MSELTELTKKLWTEYFIGDDETVLGIMDMFIENSSIIGTGEHEFYRNLDEFQNAIYSELNERKNILFTIKHLECDEITMSQDTSLVFGKLEVCWENNKRTMKINLDGRFSIVYKKVNNIWKIFHIHLSTSNPEQLEGEFYPKTLVGQVETAREMIESLTQLAETDGLTGLMNLRTLKEKYNLMDKKDTWLFVVDIDDFKEINDKQGHLQGNHALLILSEILVTTIRQNDLVCRMGGDEFILLCTGIKTEKGALKFVERLLSNVQVHSKDNPPLISVSVGFTSVKEGDRFETAFERADNALYSSKRNGKGKASAEYRNKNEF